MAALLLEAGCCFERAGLLIETNAKFAGAGSVCLREALRT
jgi:hypothetical protein